MEIERPRWRSRAWLAATIVLSGLVLSLLTVGFGTETAPNTGTVVLLSMALVSVAVIAWTALRVRAQRQRYEAELASWASDRAAQAERLRIAAELHDLVSHGLGVITVRAAAARRASSAAGDHERQLALTDIERVSRETTTELRRMLTVLRDPGAAPLQPADSLSDLPAIVESASAVGLSVELHVEELGEVSPGVQLAACAIVREALANTLRHAGPSKVQVSLKRDAGVDNPLVVCVRDRGPQDNWQPHPGAGHGLRGLRDRVTMFGGTLEAGPDGAGFQVIARLPDQGRV